MSELVTIEELQTRILDSVSSLPVFPQPLMETLGLPVAEDVVAPIALPSFANSASKVLWNPVSGIASPRRATPRGSHASSTAPQPRKRRPDR